MKKNKRKILNIIILIIALGLVLFFSLKDNYSHILNDLKKIKVLYFILAILLFNFSLLFKSLGLKNFINEYKKEYSIKKAYELTLIAQFLNAITPFQTGGQPFQIYLLKKDGLRVSDSSNAMLKDFIAYQIALIFIGIVAILLNIKFNLFDMKDIKFYFVLLGFIINIIVLFILIFIMKAKKTGKKIINKIIDFIFKLKIMKKFNFKKENVINSVNRFYELGETVDKKRIIVSTIYHEIFMITLYLVPILIFKSLNINNITIIDSIVYTSFVMLISNFIPVPGATGGIEYSFTQFFGIPCKSLTIYSAMLLWRFVTYILSMTTGAIVLIIKKWREKV